MIAALLTLGLALVSIGLGAWLSEREKERQAAFARTLNAAARLRVEQRAWAERKRRG